MGTTSGTIKKLSVGGLILNVKADADIKLNPSSAVEAEATSGEPNIKITRQVPTAESITFNPTPLQDEILDQWARDGEAKNCVITKADKSTYSALCRLNYEGVTSASNVGTLMMIPIDGQRFTLSNV